MSYFVFALKRVYDSGRPPLREGAFRTREEAWAASRRMIDEYLRCESASCPSAQALYERAIALELARFAGAEVA